MSKVTVGDVARAAGVSRATADRVLNRRGGVSEARERVVLGFARDLGLDRNLEVAPSKMLRVCVLMKPPHNPFYKLLTRGFREANLLFASHSIASYVQHIDVLSPESIQEQLRQVSENYDALIIVAPYENRTVETLGILSERMPVVTLSTDLPIDRPHYYVGPDNYRAGRIAGQLMGRLLGRSGGDILLMAGLSDFSGHRERVAGFRDILADEFATCRIAAEIETLDRNALAVDAIDSTLTKFPEIHGIYNVSQANDVVTAQIDKLRPNSDIVFICHDLTETTSALLRNGSIDVIIDQDPKLEAQRAMEIVLKHFGRLEGTPTQKSMPVRIYFRENLSPDMF